LDDSSTTEATPPSPHDGRARVGRHPRALLVTPPQSPPLMPAMAPMAPMAPLPANDHFRPGSVPEDDRGRMVKQACPNFADEPVLLGAGPRNFPSAIWGGGWSSGTPPDGRREFRGGTPGGGLSPPPGVWVGVPLKLSPLPAGSQVCPTAAEAAVCNVFPWDATDQTRARNSPQRWEGGWVTQPWSSSKH